MNQRNDSQQPDTTDHRLDSFTLPDASAVPAHKAGTHPRQGQASDPDRGSNDFCGEHSSNGVTRVLILGSTGSIGTQALEVLSASGGKDRWEVVGLAAGGGNPQLLIDQARQWSVPAGNLAVASSEAAGVVGNELGSPVRSGADSAEELTRDLAPSCDVVLNGLVGALGLGATVETLKSGTRLALANKESLVCGGQLVIDLAKPGQLIPVDSEHSAMAQCLRSGRTREVSRLVLTASGGPFRGYSRAQLMDVTPEQAGAHPTWNMGQMNTLNSASMVNKGLELIEASLMFDVPPERIDVTVHPQSIIHSMVTFCDGATIAQASPPSMKLPIALALAWPDRIADAQPSLDFTEVMNWRFEPLDDTVFPAVALARDSVSAGGSVPAIYNAANEVAADAFLRSRLAFPYIVDTVGAVLDELANDVPVPTSIGDVLEADQLARVRAKEHVRRWGVE